jgi:nitrite reductase (NADH) large subunit
MDMTTATIERDAQASAAAPAVRGAAVPPIVIVGAGPVGLRVAHELQRRAADVPVVIYGDERWEPYNRVRLSAFLAGELGWQSVVADSTPPQGEHVELRLGCAVIAIDRASRCVIDATGRAQPYAQLVLATGSRPVVPDIPGIRLAGVFTFRSLSDAERLIARRMRSRRTAVIGGGLLGLEAARAMRRYGTDVCVIEHTDRLMARQLDRGAALVLQRHVERLRIEVLVDDAVKEVIGERDVRGLRLRSGRVIDCDTVIVAAGIAPNIDLAVRAGLALGRGVKVDDRMQTSDPAIFAAGECAEHRGRVYGLVAPGLEQAAVLAHCLLGGSSGVSLRYTGSVAATRLKVLDLPVFSIGAVGDAVPDLARITTYSDPDGDTYRSVVHRQGRLIGAIAVGSWDELNRAQEAVAARRRVWPWQRLQLSRRGTLWPRTKATAVAEWPDAAVVCNCTGVTCGQLRGALARGNTSVVQLAACTGASTVCGSCKPQLEALAGSAGPAEPVGGARWLWATGIVAAVLATLLLVAPGLPYPSSWDLRWRWDALWRNGLYKQLSGFTLLGLMALLALLSLRKRVRPLRLGSFAGWRVVHVLLGAAALLALVVHSGGRFGANLNLALSLSVLGAAAAGALASAALAREHAAPATARRLKRSAFWVHVLALWPLPVLLAFHVLKTYAF